MTVQVYEGDGTDPDRPGQTQTVWRMWRGNDQGDDIPSIEILGFIPKPAGAIPLPPDEYLQEEHVYLTSDTGQEYHWDDIAQQWDWITNGQETKPLQEVQWQDRW